MSNRHVRSGRFAKKVTTAFRPNRGGGNQPGAPPQESDDARPNALKGHRKFQFRDPFRVHDSIRISLGRRSTAFADSLAPGWNPRAPQAQSRAKLAILWTPLRSQKYSIPVAHATGRRCAGLPALTKCATLKAAGEATFNESYPPRR